MTLDQAIDLLLDVHTRSDELRKYVVEMGATPYGYQVDYYAEAWGALWEHREAYRQRMLSNPSPTNTEVQS